MLKESKIGKKIQTKLGMLLLELPLSPTQITLLSVSIAILGFFLSVFGLFFAAFLCFFFAAIFDMLDGAIARLKGKETAKGAYLDGISDRVVEFLLLLSFLFLGLPSFVLPPTISIFSILFFGSTMTAFATAYAHHRHLADESKIKNQPSFFARAERVSFLLSSFLLAQFQPLAASALLFATAIFCLLAFAKRVYYFANC
ncbi:MAG: CDP-alcohol phosphatidyltransferase family protein [Candidatus Micrarchaeota archaeon]|nr:CDP-alcohol phosphatidyltransferase family protein [Candidatus Micrarchaeota archaeon]